MQKWMVLNKWADFKAIGERFHIDQVTARIIRNREVISDEEIHRYLNGGIADLHNPHLLKDADRLTDLLLEKIKQKKMIRIVGDYDIDGIMATYVLYTVLKQCGGMVSTQIPERIYDGYGLNRNIIERAYKEGIDTVITCDNGIAAIDEIAYAKELGMTVLVTDHHAIPYEETDSGREFRTSVADAIVNPHQSECPYPYKELCGAAVAWKVACILYEKCGFSTSYAEDLLEYVGFATIGDVMPLTGENRIIVKEGLKRIRQTNNLGMQALIAQCQIEAESINAGTIGFRLGPCINATGRLDTAKRALELLFASDSAQAVTIANELVELNNERKELTEIGIQEAIDYYETHACAKDKVLVLYLPQVHESIAGIIAGRIREKYYRPVLVLTNAEDGSIKGSGRSIEEYSMYEELCKCKDLLSKFGGHPMAAGLSMKKENLDAFRCRLNEVCTLSETDLIEKIRIDVPMPLDYVSTELVQELSVLEPFGKDNEHPIFADRGVGIGRLWIVGKNQNVLRCDLITSGGRRVAGVYFGDIATFQEYIIERFGKQELEAVMQGRKNAIRLSIIYDPEINRFRGEESLQFKIRHYQ